MKSIVCPIIQQDPNRTNELFGAHSLPTLCDCIVVSGVYRGIGDMIEPSLLAMARGLLFMFKAPHYIWKMTGASLYTGGHDEHFVSQLLAFRETSRVIVDRYAFQVA